MKVPQFILDNSEGTVQSPKISDIRGALYGNYDIRVEHTNDMGFIKEFHVGRGSIGAFDNIKHYLLDKNISPILEIGRMCEFSQESLVIVDGEHDNDEVINYSLGPMPITRLKLRLNKKYKNPLHVKGNTVIGSNVTVSRRAMILSGVKVGNGAVIGAGAIVTKDVPAYSIVVGNPAKVIRHRFDERVIEKLEDIRWWDFEYSYLFSNIQDIQKMSAEQFIERFGDVSNNVYHTSKDKFVFGNEGPMSDCLGCDLDGKFVPYEKLNESIKFFVDQAKLPANSKVHMVRNILDCRD